MSRYKPRRNKQDFCENCLQATDSQKFCSVRCIQEYHNMNVRMSEQCLNVLQLLHERRNWVSIQRSITTDSLCITRVAPLIVMRNETLLTCEAHILPRGEYWLDYHQKAQAA